MNEFATTANLSESNVCERTLVGVRRGEIPCYKIGKNLLFRRDELITFIGICRVFIKPN